ncbi:MAG TPA: DUF6603 domain-containing protein [Thermoleophilaceae bacterium]
MSNGTDDTTPTPAGQAALLRELGILIAPLEDLASGSAATKLVRELGYDFPAATAFPVDFTSLLTDVTNVGKGVVALEAAETDDDQLDAVIQLAADLVPLIEAVVKLEQDLENGLAAMQQLVTQSDITTELPVRLLDYLVLRYLIERAGPTFDVLLLAGLVDFVYQEADASKFQLDALIPTVYWDRIPKLFSKPSSLLDEAYGWSTDFDADLMIQRLGSLGRKLGLPMGTSSQSDTVADALGRDQDYRHELRLALVQTDGSLLSSTYGEFGLRAFSVPGAGAQQPGIAVMPYLVGSSALTGTLGSWTLELDTSLTLSDGVAAIMRPPNSLDVQVGLLSTPGTETSGTLSLKASGVSQSPDGLILLGSPGATRMSVAELDLGFTANISTQSEFVFEIGIVDLLILVEAGDGDGFIQRILPADGIKAQASLDASYSSTHGLTLKGSGSLEVDLPIGITIANIIRIDELIVTLGIDETELTLALAVNGGLSIGPVAASVEGVGIRAGLAPQSDRNGNGGPLAVHVGFKPPTGLGMSVDAGPVGGGGFLLFDEDQEQYGGGIELDLQALDITAIGLLTTRMPDGSHGFSLIVVLAAKFSPIQLGFGFTLNGIGGLVGINRGMNTDFLRSGLKDGTLDSIRFPHDIAANAPRIISDLRNAFPVQEDEYVFGPMVAIGWGSPTIVELDIGLVLQLPSPLVLAIIGTLKLMLPPIEGDEDAVILKIQLDLLGVIDFDKGEVSFDGVLRDSRVVTFPLSGQMAMRASFGDSPTFAMSAGGFNPKFQPPPKFPSLDRMSLALADGNNPRLRLDAYFAVTSNSLQLGAKLDLYVEKDLGAVGDFTVQGYLSFDGMLKFSPFSFEVDIGAQLELKRNGDEFCGITLSMTLTGPQPWHAWGNAEFKVLGCSKSVSFDLTVGDPPPPAPLPPVDPLPLLATALADKNNWSANPPTGVGAIVTMRDQPPSDDVVVHPLGTLTVRQRVVPLDFQIQQYGHADLAGGRNTFGIDSVSVGTAQPAQTELRDHFAPGDFLKLSDDEKLSRPAFESLKAGLSLGTPGLTAGTRAQANFGYKQVIIDSPTEARTLSQTGTISPDVLSSLANGGAAGRSAVRTSGQARYAGHNAPVTVSDTPYAVATKDGLAAPSGVTAGGDTYAEAEAARRGAADPDSLQVVGAHELA